MAMATTKVQVRTARPARTSLPKFLSAREVADVLGVSEVTVWRLKRHGVLPPATRLSPGRVGWSEDAIAGYVAAQTPSGP